jgi:hypothetical protein
MVRTIGEKVLPNECPEAETMNIQGFVSGSDAIVFQGLFTKTNSWSVSNKNKVSEMPAEEELKQHQEEISAKKKEEENISCNEEERLILGKCEKVAVLKDPKMPENLDSNNSEDGNKKESKPSKFDKYEDKSELKMTCYNSHSHVFVIASKVGDKVIVALQTQPSSKTEQNIIESDNPGKRFITTQDTMFGTFENMFDFKNKTWTGDQGDYGSFSYDCPF